MPGTKHILCSSHNGLMSYVTIISILQMEKVTQK